MRVATSLSIVALALIACSSSDADNATSSAGTGAAAATGATATSSATGSPASSVSSGSSSSGAGGAGGAGGSDPGPNVDLTNPQLYSIEFKASDADPNATAVLAPEPAYLDTRVKPRGLLVVYLHGAGVPSVCGSREHEKMLAGLGYHVLGPCYVSDYGVDKCGADIEGCRLEAFEGVDHTPVIDVKPPDSIETRVVKGLTYLQTKIPAGDWTYFLDGSSPKWSKIIISGISHGASSSGVIGLHRVAHRVVMLSGPLDTGQAWLKKPTLTPIDRFFGFTHTADPQHAGHLQAFTDMGLAGQPTSVDNASPDYGGSHRLETSAPTNDGHSSLQAGGASPKTASGDWVFQPAWEDLYNDGP